jgi:hypothetical protein
MYLPEPSVILFTVVQSPDYVSAHPGSGSLPGRYLVRRLVDYVDRWSVATYKVTLPPRGSPSAS